MRKMTFAVGLLGVGLLSVSAQVVKNPLKDFFKSDPLSNTDKLTVIKGDLTGDSRYSFLINDGHRDPGMNGGQSWEVYYPASRGRYLKAIGDYLGVVPSYIGYVDEIKRNGIVQVVTYKRSSIVSAQFLDGGVMNSTILFDGTSDYKKKFSKYFTGLSKFTTTTYTFDQLKKQYGSPASGVRVFDQ